MSSAKTSGSAPVFDVGKHKRAISTRSPQAQKYFDQGLNLMFGFNLEEAQRSFEEAARLDSSCAACWWGVALSLGPHINVPAMPERTVPAYHAARRADGKLAGASPVERALIEAIQHRYADPAPTDPKIQFGLDSTYAQAMRGVAQKFPDDDDVQMLFAESLMDLHPWDYWNGEQPQPWTPEIVTLLEKIIARNPEHPGANHLYIHILEASPHPEKALASADRLRDAMPDAGHLVHMPSHIYERVGRYSDAALANRKAIESDKAYIKKANPQGFYWMYVLHNIHFLSWTSMKEGRSVDAIQHARTVVKQAPPQLLSMMPGTDIFLAEPYFALIRFGKWQEILDEPRPAKEYPFLTCMWRYARGLAWAGRGQVENASDERDSLNALASTIPADAVEALNSAHALTDLASNMLAGIVAAGRRDTALAIRKLEQAVQQEDALRYDEPADWMVPARHYLGHLLLLSGRAAEAEVVYREDLAHWAENGWALFGLEQSLRAQKKTAEADEVAKRFKAAWARADVKLTASRF